MVKTRRKPRHYDSSLRHVDLTGMFPWVRQVCIYRQFIPSAYITYSVILAKDIEEHQRKQFEEFLSEFYETKRNKHAFICCWRKSEVIVTIF